MTTTHSLIKQVSLEPFMDWPKPFDSAHAEREIQRLDAPAQTLVWTAPNGRPFQLTVPPTVYPPREDTDLLASVLDSRRLNPGTRWLEIGCGSGALSLYAATFGCDITACDVNPLAVAASRAHFANIGRDARIYEGGPGPFGDGSLSQWGGDRLYDVVVWNTPYLSFAALEDGVLGPMEEAGLVDTDSHGLIQRFFAAVAGGRLLNQQGVAFLTVSSKGVAGSAQAWAWSNGLAARTVATTVFEDEEHLDVLAVWRPFSGAPVTHFSVVGSTNDEIFQNAAVVGASVRSDHQTAGRGRRRREWVNPERAMMASWLVGSGKGLNHHTLDQLRVGEGVQRLVRAWSSCEPDCVQLKWPNDLFIKNDEGVFRKAGGVLFEGASKGSEHRVVLGVGLNLQGGPAAGFGDLSDLDISLDAERVHAAVHALVASLFESVEGFGVDTGSASHIEAAVLEGIHRLGPMLYRNRKVRVKGLSETGGLLVEGLVDPVDGPEDVRWSSI